MSPKQIVNETLVSDIPLRLLDLKHFPEPEKQTNVFELFKFCQGRIMMAFNDGKKDFEASAWMEGIKKTFPEYRDHFNPPHESSLQNNDHPQDTQKKLIKEIDPKIKFRERETLLKLIAILLKISSEKHDPFKKNDGKLNISRFSEWLAERGKDFLTTPISDESIRKKISESMTMLK